MVTHILPEVFIYLERSQRPEELHLANAVKSERGKFLHIGTAGVYGTLMRSGGIEGEYEVRPESELSQTRAEGEMVAVSAGATVVRPLFVTGAGDRHFLLPLLRAHLLLNAWIEEGAARLSVVSNSQLAAAVTEIGSRVLDGSAPSIVHVVPAEPISVRELLTPILTRLGKTLTNTISLDQAIESLGNFGISRRKVEQFGRDYFLCSSYELLQPMPAHLMTRESAEWVLSEFEKIGSPRLVREQ